MRTWDVVIVGGGPSGAAAAYDLAHKGYKTLILEKKQFPRTKPCAGGLTIKALMKLRFPISHLIHDQAKELATGYRHKAQATLTSRSPICAFVVRKEFDEYCLSKAIEQGAEFQIIRGISDITESNTGVSLRTADGDRIHAKYLIGADGAHSQVRKLTSQFTPDRTAVAVEGLLPRDLIQDSFQQTSKTMTLDFGAQNLGYGWLFPKGDHVNVGLFTYLPGTAKLSKAALSHYSTTKLGCNDFDEVHGFPIATGGERYRPSHERIFLIGDAAGMAEPLLGEGIHNAIASGQAVAKSIADSLQRNEQALVHFQANIKTIQKDLLLSRRLAPWFYRLLPVAYQMLIRYPFAPVFMNGFAAGMTLTECRNAFGKFQTEYKVPKVLGLEVS